jgi:hypothetical protein
MLKKHRGRLPTIERPDGKEKVFEWVYPVLTSGYVTEGYAGLGLSG